jgi:hypothetical protein
VSGRWSSSLNQAAAELNHIGGFFAVDLDFSTGHVRANDSGIDFTWGGNTYFGVGDFGGFDSVQENIEAVARGVKFTLAGVDTGIISSIVGNVYQGRAATLYVGMVDPTSYALIDTPEIVWSGYMDTMKIVTEKDGSRIELACEHRLRNAPPYARFSSADQKARSAGDMFFDMLGFVANYRSNWGGKSSGWAYKPTGQQPS